MALDILIIVLIIAAVFLVSALPLYFAVKLLDGEVTLLKAGLVTILSGVVVSLVNLFFPVFGGIVALLVLIFIYMALFDIGFFKALFAWILQMVFVAVIGFIITVVFGITLGASLLI